jgi:hypothetical protein
VSVKRSPLSWVLAILTPASKWLKFFSMFDMVFCGIPVSSVTSSCVLPAALAEKIEEERFAMKGGFSL